MKGLPVQTDFVVVGAGTAGLRAAIDLAEAGRVLLISKREISVSHSTDIKGEAEWLSDDDDITLHLQDTLDSGAGLCNAAAVKILIEEGAERLEEVVAWGKHHGSKLSFEPENPHTRTRRLHAHGEPTAREVLKILCHKIESLKHVSAAPFTFATQLRSADGRIVGVSVLDEKGVQQELSCSAVLLTAGGSAQLYSNATGPASATADGIALALRAGAELSDMEFVQFHPTALCMKKVPRFVLPERLRTESGWLRNIELNRFMSKYHPLGERAPRDVVARAIVHEMEVSRAKDPFVYLDMTHINASKIEKSFPRVYAACMAYNIDITEDLIPVRPAANATLGGVRTDMEGKTSVSGLYAAGEGAATGVHGANRLPSNSVLEALVFGSRAAKAMRNHDRSASQATPEPKAAYSNGPVDTGTEELVGQIQSLMWNEVGVVRTRMGMQRAIKALEEIAPKLAHPTTRRGHEAANLHLAALAVARSALAREESRGTHYRMDYPDRDDKKFLKRSVVRGDKVVFM
ncbi:MAG TPA: FAD-binding protein [Candidatus Sulfotelmatobacter sp.]|nr:FAD-binding protein [Candidatus Sulfotelmatobacter sp.]